MAMTPDQTKPTPSPADKATLANWRTQMGFTILEAITALGVSERAWRRWEEGERQVPKYIKLATSALALGIKPD